MTPEQFDLAYKFIKTMSDREEDDDEFLIAVHLVNGDVHVGLPYKKPKWGVLRLVGNVENGDVGILLSAVVAITDMHNGKQLNPDLITDPAPSPGSA